jgi:transposase
MTIPWINVYSATAIVPEIDYIKRFERKEKLALYAGLTPRQN